MKAYLLCFACASALLLTSLAAAPAPAPAPASTEIFACRFGTSMFPEGFAFKGGDVQKKVKIAWSFYVLRTGTDITLMDAGLSDPVLANKWGVTFEKSPVALLADLGIAPEAVSRIVISHLHFDHVNGITAFPKARIVMSRQERDDYVGHKPIGGMVFDEAVARILADETRTHVVEKEEDLGDGLQFKVIGGHTAGSSVVSLTQAGTTYMFTGDECYLCANVTQQRPIGRTVNLKLNTDFLATLADPALVKLPCHDLEMYSRYKAVTPQIVRITAPAVVGKP